MQFNSAGSDSRIRGHCGRYVDGERNSDVHGDGGDHNGGDGQRNGDGGDGGDLVTCLEQKYTILQPNPGHIGWWRVYHTCIQTCIQTSSTWLVVAVGYIWAETVPRKVVVVSRDFWTRQGWALEQVWLLVGTVESGVGQPLAKERPLGYHRQLVIDVRKSA